MFIIFGIKLLLVSKISLDNFCAFPQELECATNLQNLLFCMHAFLTAKVAAVDPSFLRAPPKTPT